MLAIVMLSQCDIFEDWKLLIQNTENTNDGFILKKLSGMSSC